MEPDSEAGRETITTARTLRMAFGIEEPGEPLRSHMIAATRRDDGNWGVEVSGDTHEARSVVVPATEVFWGALVPEVAP